MERYDIAIIGTGPAGVSAAITAKVRNKKIILIGSKNLSSKVEKAHSIQNYPGIPDVPGGELKQKFSEHLDAMGIEITEDKANMIYAMGSYFMIQGHSQNYEANSVILAVGLSVAKPYPGEAENLGRGVSYCATCDANLYRGKNAVVIATSEAEEDEARFLAEVADKVYYIPLYKDCTDLGKSNIEVVEGVKPTKIARQESGTIKLETDKQEFEVDGIFILREQVAPDNLVPGLKVTDNHVDVDRSMRTNLKGLFACGDITGTPYQYIKSAGEGNVAALSAVSYLAEINRK